MTPTEQLETLRRDDPAIEAAAYVDFRSGTVLCANARIAPPQERLDALCATAADLLDGPAGAADAALLLTPTEAIALQRAPTNPAEALCLLAAPDCDLDRLVDTARRSAGQVTG